MSIILVAQVWKQARGLTASQRLVLLKYADCANDEGEHAYPSIGTVAAHCELSRATVFLALKRLIRDGYLTVTAPSVGPRPTEYQVRPVGGGVQNPDGLGVQNSDPTRLESAATTGSDLSTYDHEPSENPDAASPDRVAALWNTLADPAGVPRVILLTPSRQQRLRKRCKEHPTLAEWGRLFRYVLGIPFYVGKNDRGWTVTLDWLISTDCKMQGFLEKAQTPRAGSVVARTRAANLAQVTEQGVYIPRKEE